MTNNRLNIGLFTCHLDNDYAHEVCKGAEAAAKALDANLIVFPGMFLSASFNDPDNEIYDYQYNSVFYYAHQENLDALIVSVGTIASFLSQQNIQEFLAQFEGIPILTLEQKVPGYPCLQADSTAGLKDAIEHLITDHGRRNICFVSGRKENEDAQERLAVYKSTLAAHDMIVSEDMIAYGDYSEYSQTIVGELIDKNPGMDAIVFANDQMAIGGYDELKRRGMSIGEGVSVIGFDNSPASITMMPPLTTVNANTASLGYHAVEKAVELAGGTTVSSAVLASRFVRRLSCGCTHHDAVAGCSDCAGSSVADYLQTFDEMILGDIADTFYGPSVINAMNEVWADILAVVALPDVAPYPTALILDKLSALLASDVTEFYSLANIAYAFGSFSSILSSNISSPDKQIEYYKLESQISNLISQALSSNLYSKLHSGKSDEWASIYITRDTLTYGDDLAKTYTCILSKLEEIGFNASYLYTYDKPIKIKKDGRWKVPKTLFLQAFYNSRNTKVLTGEARRIPSTEVFDNEYTFYEGRFTDVVMPIFTNEQHHGLCVFSTDINGFGSIYSTALHIGASFKYLTLLAEQSHTKEQLVISLNEIHEKNELLSHWSTTDELTGINNRRGLMDKVEYLINKPDNRGRKAMLLFADMDSLKVVNDTFGHADGDFALKNIANILQTSFGTNSIIGRIGGDEFVAFSFLDNADFAREVQEKIAKLSAELNDTCGKPYYIEMSVGVSEFECTGNIKIENLLSQADNSLYTNKRYKRMTVIK